MQSTLLVIALCWLAKSLEKVLFHHATMLCYYSRVGYYHDIH